MAETSVGVAYLDIVPKLAEGFESKLSGAFAASSDSAINRISATTRKIGAGLTAGVTAPLVALGTAAIKSFDQYDQALNRFSVNTGIHGKKLEKLGAQMRKTFSNATFASFDYTAIQDAFGAVTQKFDVTGAAAGRLSRKFLALGKVTGEDVPGLVEGTAKAFAAFNIPAKRSGDLIDFIWKTSQKIGVPFGELTSGALGAQVALQAMGLSLKQGVALIGSLTEAGVASPTGALRGIGTFVAKLLSPTAVGDLKDDVASKQDAVNTILERSGASGLSQQRRIQDIMARAKNGKLSQSDQIDLARARADYGSASGKDAADLRQAQQELAVARGDLIALQKGQRDPKAALAATFNSIAQASTHNKALGIATKAFGGRAGGALVNPIRRGQLDASGFVKLIDSKKGGVEDDAKQLVTFSDSITAFKRQIQNALIPMGGAIVKVFKSMKPQIKEFVGFIKDLAKRFTDLDPGVQQLVVVVGLLAAALGPLLIALGSMMPVLTIINAQLQVTAFTINETAIPVYAVVAAIAVLAAGFYFLYTRTEWFPKVMHGIADALAKIPEIISKAWRTIRPVVATVIGFLQGLWKSYGGNLISGAKTAWAAVQNIFKRAVGLLRSVVRFFVALFHRDWHGLWEAIKRITDNAWAIVKALVATGFRLVLDVIKSAVPLLWRAAKALWGVLMRAAQAAWPAIKRFFSGLPAAVGNLLKEEAKLLLKAALALWGVILRAAKTEAKAIRNEWRKLPDQIINALKTLVPKLIRFGFNLIKAIRKGIKDAPQSIADQIKDSVTGGFHNPLSNIGHTVKGAALQAASYLIPGFGGARAGGGPVAAGMSYLVGENEPEILTMGSSGGNISNIKRGGGGNTFNITANDPKAVVREIEKYLDRDSERNGHHDKWHNRRFVG